VIKVSAIFGMVLANLPGKFPEFVVLSSVSCALAGKVVVLLSSVLKLLVMAGFPSVVVVWSEMVLV